MPVNVTNPYTGKPDETCSVSFAAQHQMAGTTGSAQTEAQYNTSQQLGEWGVIAAKLKKKEFADGTKLLTYNNVSNGSRGYFYVKDGQLRQKSYAVNGKSFDTPATPIQVETYVKSKYFTTAIPHSAAAQPHESNAPTTDAATEYAANALLSVDYAEAVTLYGKDNVGLSHGKVTIWAGLGKAGLNKPGAQFYYHGAHKDEFTPVGTLVTVVPGHSFDEKSSSLSFVDAHGNEVSHQVSGGAKWWIEYVPKEDGSTPLTPKKKDIPHKASPTPSPAVPTGSTSVGSMSHEDVAAMFVKIKDDLAKEKGLNIKGANADLDQLVYAAIGEKTGYTPSEVKAKIDAYKADGNKLSALKKKVMSGSKKVPDGQAQPTKASPHAPLNSAQHTHTPVSDPQPNGVPTTATPALANEAKAAVEQKVVAQPGKHYSDEDIAAQYIIAKDTVVAASHGQWTLYSKSDELDAKIYGAIEATTGFTKPQAQAALASYLGSGKKLSTLKKQLAKQGAFTPQADTLKSGKATPDKDKAKDVTAKADAGYTPTPEKATGTPSTDTGQIPPHRMQKESQESGDISGIGPTVRKLYFDKFKATGSQSWLSSGPAQNYDGLLKVQSEMQQLGHSKNLTLLQLIRVIDEEGATKAGVDNGKLFEKQVATWLTTPAGTQHVKNQEAQKAKLADQAKKKAEAEAAAKALEDNQPALPADSGQFEDWSLSKATAAGQRWLAERPFTAAQKAGLRHYTGSAYVAMNNYLRGLSPTISDGDKKHIVGAKDGMRPTDEPILVRRGTGASQFVTLGVGHGNTNLLWGLTGKSFKDEGFLSTSAGGRAAFGGECLLEIECPVGTPMMYVDPFSKNSGENEMLLQAGLTYKVLQVRKQGGQFVIRCRVVDWPGKV